MRRRNRGRASRVSENSAKAVFLIAKRAAFVTTQVICACRLRWCNGRMA